MATRPKRSIMSLFKALAILLFIIIIARLAALMVFSSTVTKQYEDPAVAEAVERGTIFDRNQRILAIQTPYWGVYFHLQAIEDLAFVSEVVAPYVDLSADQVMARARSYTTYAQIKDAIDDQSATALRKAIALHRLGAQVSIEKHQGRTWPAHFHGVQTIGFTNSSGEGIEGVEFSQEKYLNPWPAVGEELITYGDEITLTLDLDIQYAVDVELQAMADSWFQEYAAAIVLDAKSGDILAMGSWPWYDANRYSQSSALERRNHAVNQLTEPGSVFKLFSMAAIIEAGDADLSEPFFCDGTYTFYAGNTPITINCSSAHGEVDVSKMLSESCNGAISYWARQSESERFYQSLVDLGFTDAWDIGLPSRARSQIASPSSWSARSKPTIAFGQELLTTALHISAAATALSPSGELLAPNLILERRDGATGELLWRREMQVVKEVFSSDTTARIREGMRLGALEGTGTYAAVEGISVGVKTGTAQILNPHTKSYSDGTLYTSALALVPIEDPKYIIYVGAGSPQGENRWGATIAAPAVGNIIRALASQGKLKKTLK